MTDEVKGANEAVLSETLRSDLSGSAPKSSAPYQRISPKIFRNSRVSNRPRKDL